MEAASRLSAVVTAVWCLVAAAALSAADVEAGPAVAAGRFGLRIVDRDTGRGVPLATLRTVNDITLVTDSSGWAAFEEPGLMGREVYFGLSCPGYECPPDGFGFRGVRPVTKPGTSVVVRVKRTAVAERLYRITGQGIYRDSSLLGVPAPAGVDNLTAGVVGQDSVQSLPYRGGLFWLWGDTSLAHYPLGNFQTTAGMSAAPGKPGCEPGVGITLKYFTKPDGRVRPMLPLAGPGAVWIFGLLAVADPAAGGKDTLVAHYSRHKSLDEIVEHGIARFDDEAGVFKSVVTLKQENAWRFPRGNAVRVKDADGEFFYFASPYCHTRVRASLAAVLDAEQYEALAFDPAVGRYRWQRESGPTTQAEEAKLIRAGKLSAAEPRYQLVDAVTGKPVVMHGGSVEWNEHRMKWVLVGVQMGGKDDPSVLGEVWYAEAAAAAGPWRKAVKVATHPGVTFYNPRQHPYFAEGGGRTIYFEGTFTHTFSGHPVAVPRYEYNQLMYRLDVDDARLKAAR